MKIQNVKTVENFSPIKHWEKEKMYSIVIDEILKLTDPHGSNSPMRKMKLYFSISDYLFNDDESAFYAIESYTNVLTACNLKGYRFLIQKNNIQSFAALDKFMAIKKEKSFARLNQSLSHHETLNENQKDKIIGGRKWSQIFTDIFSPFKRTA